MLRIRSTIGRITKGITSNTTSSHQQHQPTASVTTAYRYHHSSITQQHQRSVGIPLVDRYLNIRQNTGSKFHQQYCYFSSKDKDDDNDNNDRKSDRGKPRRNNVNSKNDFDDTTTTTTTTATDESLTTTTIKKSSRSKNDDTLSLSSVMSFEDDERFVTPEDPFGLLFQDGSDRLGPILPPIYERDSITGRLIAEDTVNNSDTINATPTTMMMMTTTMKQQQQLSEQDKKILNMDSIERDMQLLESVQKHWQEQNKNNNNTDTNTTTTTTSTDSSISEFTVMGERIRTTDIATNVLGRSVHGQKIKEIRDDGTEIIARDTEYNFSQPLTLEEFNAFEVYMKTKHDMNITVDDIPVSTQQTPNPIVPPPSTTTTTMMTPGRSMNKSEEVETVHPDEAELSLKWLTSRAQRQMDDSLDDNPYSDLMPGDLSPKRVVNRKHAKIIPTKLLHYNHMSLLQHFIGPTGQIMNRSQTRLGARDQRRISRLIKRSRALGLIPYIGQFKIENHGWVHTNDIHTQRTWEHQLEQRGLVIIPSSKSSSQQQQQQQQAKQQQQLSNTTTTTTTTTINPTPSTPSSSSSNTMGYGALPDNL